MRAQLSLLVLALAVGTSALEVYLVAARGRPIGPPSEREQGPETVAPGTVGIVDDSLIGEQEPIPISRAEFLMSSPPADLPVLRESVANMPAPAATKASAAGPAGMHPKETVKEPHDIQKTESVFD